MIEDTDLHPTRKQKAWYKNGHIYLENFIVDANSSLCYTTSILTLRKASCLVNSIRWIRQQEMRRSSWCPKMGAGGYRNEDGE